MSCTACTEPQCLYKGALYLTSVPVQGCTLPYLRACTRVTFTFYLDNAVPFLVCCRTLAWFAARRGEPGRSATNISFHFDRSVHSLTQATANFLIIYILLFIVYLNQSLAVTVWCQTVRWLGSTELQRVWKKMVLDSFEDNSGIFLEELWRTATKCQD